MTTRIRRGDIDPAEEEVEPAFRDDQGRFTFTVAGIPQQQGSKRILGRNLVEANHNLEPWRQEVISACRKYRGPKFGGAVGMSLRFWFPRIRAHYGTGTRIGKLKKGAAIYKTTAPDLDKLIRAIGDAVTLAGTIYRDDAQIAHFDVEKRYGDHPGVDVVVWDLDESAELRGHRQ